MYRVFRVRFHAVGQVSVSRREIYLRQMLGALLSASDERESEGDNAIFWSTHALAQSSLGATSRV